MGQIKITNDFLKQAINFIKQLFLRLHYILDFLILYFVIPKMILLISVGEMLYVKVSKMKEERFDRSKDTGFLMGWRLGKYFSPLLRELTIVIRNVRDLNKWLIS